MTPAVLAVFLPALLALAGCAAVAPDLSGGFPEVSGIVRDRIGNEIVRRDPAAGDDQAGRLVGERLADGLTAEEAVAIALLENRMIQATYADLGVAQSDLVEASLLHNPVLDAGAGFPISGGPLDLSVSVALDVIDLLYVPLRKRVAAAAFEEAKLRVAAQVLDLAWSARTAFLRHQANEQMLEMLAQIVESTGASHELSKRLQEAGNATDLELFREQALAQEARLELRRAEIAARESRERLNEILGLWGDGTAWTLASSRLPDPPEAPLPPEGLETLAVERSLDLAAARHHLAAVSENLRLTRASALFPEFLVGGDGEREGEWEAGPSLAIPLPFFDRGQGRIARAKAELRRSRDLHHALAVRVRSAVRSARDRAAGERERAVYYRAMQLPLRERIVRETRLHYNAMQTGPLDLLRAKEEQIETAVHYVETLRDYWLARADLDLILAGRIPPAEPALEAPRILEEPRFPFPALH